MTRGVRDAPFGAAVRMRNPGRAGAAVRLAWLALGLGGAGNAGADIRTGDAAYGDWRTDAPGVVRRIDPDALKAPYSSGSASNTPSVVARPAGALPSVPPGFAVDVFAEGLDGPRQLKVGPGGSVYVAETGADRITVIRPDGVKSLFADHLDGPFGMAFWPASSPRYLYVAENNRVVRLPLGGGPPETIIARIARTTGYHTTRDLALAPDGDFLLSVGSGSNVSGDVSDPALLAAHDRDWGLGAAWGSETGRADVRRFPPDGAGGLRPYANGLRNCVGLAVGGGNVWCAVNERDGLGDNVPPDYVTRVSEGGFYGWPWFYIGRHPDPRVAAPPPGLTVSVPDVPVQPHSAPLGIAVYDAAAFGPDYAGDAFVALHGSWNRATRTGYKLVRVHAPGGVPDGTYQDFMTGFVRDDGHVWGRPAAVAVAPDGALLVSDDAANVIWRIIRTRDPS